MSRSKFKDRLDREVQQGKITRRQRRQCLKTYDKRQPGSEDAMDDAMEGVFSIILGALGFGRED